MDALRSPRIDCEHHTVASRLQTRKRMKGYVPTPDATVDLMVDKLLRDVVVGASTRILDAGCGPGAFIHGLLRWCARHGRGTPRIDGIELDPAHARVARASFHARRGVAIREADFLRSPAQPTYDLVVANPPYVSITGLSEAERLEYRRVFATASGRFDLYMLFFEHALAMLRPGGRLVFITPEKFLYVASAEPLRRLLGRWQVEELHLLDERTFGNLVTYPLVTTVRKVPANAATTVIARDGRRRDVDLAGRIGSWLPLVEGATVGAPSLTLGEACLRISCGVATGADAVFVMPAGELPAALRRFARPTIAGRQLLGTDVRAPRDVMLLPYDDRGVLVPESKLGALGRFLAQSGHRERLLRRTCARAKPWYAFHETPQLTDMARPKILCKDIGSEPRFVIDAEGDVVPRHSVYYLVPRDPDMLAPLAAYLNSAPAGDWLRANCQRAANGFLRLQSNVLKRMPVPDSFRPAGIPAQAELTLPAA
ncbi:MAG: N-6 DNA methylase [Gemmatimonadales bacterium]|nr:N-6 DNA methylase [Gemmatimonadales bacterium]